MKNDQVQLSTMTVEVLGTMTVEVSDTKTTNFGGVAHYLICWEVGNGVHHSGWMPVGVLDAAGIPRGTYHVKWNAGGTKRKVWKTTPSAGLEVAQKDLEQITRMGFVAELVKE